MTSSIQSLVPSSLTISVLVVMASVLMTGFWLSETDQRARRRQRAAAHSGQYVAWPHDKETKRSLRDFITSLRRDVHTIRTVPIGYVQSYVFYAAMDVCVLMNDERETAHVDPYGYEAWSAAYLSPCDSGHIYSGLRLFQSRPLDHGIQRAVTGADRAVERRIDPAHLDDLDAGQIPRLVDGRALLEDFESAICRFADALHENTSLERLAEQRWQALGQPHNLEDVLWPERELDLAIAN